MSVILIPRRLNSHQHLEHMEDPVTHFHSIVQILSLVDSHQTLCKEKKGPILKKKYIIKMQKFHNKTHLPT